jgi:hypothetical protein
VDYIEVEYNGKRYTKRPDGGFNNPYGVEKWTWYGPNNVAALGSLVRRLDRMADAICVPEVNELWKFQELVDRAKVRRDQGVHGCADALIKKALRLEPGHLGAIAVLCSILRHRNRPSEALAETEAYKYSNYEHIPICRAAAKLDLKDCQRAKKALNRAFRLIGDNTNRESFKFAMEVWRRWKKLCDNGSSGARADT